MSGAKKQTSIFDDNFGLNGAIPMLLDEDLSIDTTTPVDTTQRTDYLIDEPLAYQSIPELEEEVTDTTQEVNQESSTPEELPIQTEGNGEVEDDVNPYDSVMNYLIDQGLLDNPSSEIEASLEGLTNLFNQKQEKYFNEKLNNLSEETKKRIEFELQGGNYEQVIDNYVNFDLVDLEDADNKKAILLDYYTSIGKIKDPESFNIDGVVEDFEVKGVLDNIIEDAVLYLKNEQAREIQYKEKEYKQRLELEKREKELAIKAKQEEQKAEILSLKSLKGFEISPEDAKNLYDYMYVVDPKSKKTKAELNHTKEDLYMLEYIKMKNLNLGSIQKKAQTEATKQIKKVFQRQEKPSLNAIKEEVKSVPKIPDAFSIKTKY